MWQILVVVDGILDFFCCVIRPEYLPVGGSLRAIKPSQAALHQGIRGDRNRGKKVNLQQSHNLRDHRKDNRMREGDGIEGEIKVFVRIFD